MLNQLRCLFVKAFENTNNMGIEIERKFLLKNEDWKSLVSKSTVFKQGYLVSGANLDDQNLEQGKSSVRIRIEGECANINIKSMTLSITRQEYEYSIPLDDALKMLDELCEKPLVEKTRHIVKYDSHKWEVDVFSGANEGLVVAEIELNDEAEKFSIPSWIGQEVSDQVKYYNMNLIHNPYLNWNE